MNKLSSEPMSEAEAQYKTKEFAAENIAAFADRDWKATRFERGWLMAPMGDDLKWVTGLPGIIVLDDGRCFQDSLSFPPNVLYEKYVNME